MKTSENAALKKKKRNKLIVVSVILILFIVQLAMGWWWQAGLFLLIVWAIHEVLYSDHIFYCPKSDYTYDLDSDFETEAELKDARLRSVQIHIQQRPKDPKLNTWMLAIPLNACSIPGKIYDPYVVITCGNKQQKQYFERGMKGLRYINLSAFSDELRSGRTITLKPTFCKLISHQGKLLGFSNPDYSQKKTLIIAPHADDAEIAAFGYYSSASDVHITTLTAGEIEMEDFLHIYKQPENASHLKGRLRSMDSISVPLWGGVHQENCIQLGYFCKRLEAMEKEPDKEFASHTAGTSDTRLFREFNSRKLASDAHGKPTWNHLVQDLVELLDEIQPEVIITPNMELDPHSDHIYATKAIREAVCLSSVKPEFELLYANHYRTTDIFPFGPPHSVPGLVPNFEMTKPYSLYSFPLNKELQLSKIYALEMMHDLKSRVSFKKRVRNWLQRIIIKRHRFLYGDDAYFDKAIMQQELFTIARSNK